jgi:nucleotide-binding universal stress UspA family protein
MTETILLAVDAAKRDPAAHVTAAAEMTRKLAHDTGDSVIVLHVHEFATGRWGRMQVDCNEGGGENVVDQVVSGLRDAGITANGVIGTADFGHIARAILAAADEHDARIIVVGSSSRTDLPHLPIGSVSNRLLHLARRPVLIVPKQTGHAKSHAEAAAADAAATVTG